MSRFADPTFDITFKKLFADKNHKPVLISFLNAILGHNGTETIVDVDILDTNNLPETLGQPLTILDVKCIDQKGHQYIVEMQRKFQSHFAERSLFYTAQVYARQLTQGAGYKDLMPVIFVGVLNYTTFTSKNPVSHHLILNTETSNQELKHQEFHFIELPKFTKKEEELETIIDKWIFLLKNAGGLDHVPETLCQDKVLQEALAILSTHLWSRRELEIYDKQLDNIRVNQDVLETAMKEGLAQGRVEGREDGLTQGQRIIAKKMLSEGFKEDLIANITGLNLEEIKKIK